MPKGEGIWQHSSQRFLKLLDTNPLVFLEKNPSPCEIVWHVMAKDTL